MAFYEWSDHNLRIISGRGFSFPPHLHRQVELLCVTDGELEVMVEDQRRRMCAGELALIWPNRVHSYHCDEPGQQVLIIASLSCLPEFRGAFLRGECPAPFLSRAHPDVYRALEALTAEPSMPPALQHAYLGLIVGRALEALPQQPAASQQADLLHALLSYLTEHFREPLQLEDVARQLYVSKYTVSRVLSQQIGCNLHTYLNRLRVEAAQTELIRQELSLSEVAERCGFASERTFFRAFRACTGMTPAQYRGDSRRGAGA